LATPPLAVVVAPAEADRLPNVWESDALAAPPEASLNEMIRPDFACRILEQVAPLEYPVDPFPVTS
jgi:hypothetical protein